MLKEGAVPDARIVIGGEESTTGSDGIVSHLYPATGEENGQVPLGGEPEIEDAVAAAEAALPAWEALGPSGRRTCLLNLARVLQEWASRLDVVATAETGIPKRGFAWRHALALEWLHYYAGFAEKIGGDVTASGDDGTLEYTRLEPYGVVGIIITWNSPLLSLLMKVPAALAAGNTVVVKPSELTPYTPTLFALACREAGMPAGVVNVVPGAVAAGNALTRHPRVEKISFTGGTKTATAMMHAGADRLKSFCFELGGKSAYVVFPDSDVDLAVGLAARELSNAGQSCKMGSRLILHRSVHDRFVEALAGSLGQLQVGDPELSSTDVGPLITRASQERVLAVISGAAGQGQGQLLLGGGIPDLPAPFDGGYYVEPTIFVNVDPASSLATEEVFGPVFASFPFDDEEEALALANSTDFGLSGYIFTRDVRKAHRSAARMRAGTVYVNDANRRNPGAPFGGYGLSGLGAEGGRPGLDEFLRKKTIGIA